MKPSEEVRATNFVERQGTCFPMAMFDVQSIMLERMRRMISIQVDERALESKFLKELRKQLEQIEQRYTFWDMRELMRQTNMSENSIKEKFFYDPRFPKHKIGSKWYFPAKKCETFLLEWIEEQPRN